MENSMPNATVLRNVMNLIPPPPPAKSDYSDSIVVRTLPLIGRVHLVNDTGGIMQLAFVFAYWVYGTFCTLYIILLPQYEDGNIPLSVIISFMIVSVLCLLALIKASITNPGRIPLLTEDSSVDTSGWYLCRTCNRKRPPRAHHCRRCRQCVARMDHHCPWINNCVGEENHFAFFLLLLYAFLLSAYTLTLTIFHFWVWPKCIACDKEAFYIRHSIWFLYLLVVLAINMSLVMALQLSSQHVNLLQDRTTLDNLQGAPDQGAKVTPEVSFMTRVVAPGPCSEDMIHEPVLFATTVMENIRYGRPDATDQEVMEAAKLANAHMFITGFPEGYHTVLGERGVTVSGGQKQRIAIARALIKNPSILILDEATSALDAESERLVQEALDRVSKGRTVVVIAHRLSTIRDAHTIAVVSHGKIVEIGDHNSLRKKRGLYWELIKQQEIEEELDHKPPS